MALVDRFHAEQVVGLIDHKSDILTGVGKASPATAAQSLVSQPRPRQRATRPHDRERR